MFLRKTRHFYIPTQDRPHLLPACSAAWPLSTQLLWESAGCASFLVPLALESDGKSCTG